MHPLLKKEKYGKKEFSTMNYLTIKKSKYELKGITVLNSPRKGEIELSLPLGKDLEVAIKKERFDAIIEGIKNQDFSEFHRFAQDLLKNKLFSSSVNSEMVYSYLFSLFRACSGEEVKRRIERGTVVSFKIQAKFKLLGDFGSVESSLYGFYKGLDEGNFGVSKKRNKEWLKKLKERFGSEKQILAYFEKQIKELYPREKDKFSAARLYEMAEWFHNKGHWFMLAAIDLYLSRAKTEKGFELKVKDFSALAAMLSRGIYKNYKTGSHFLRFSGGIGGSENQAYATPAMGGVSFGKREYTRYGAVQPFNIGVNSYWAKSGGGDYFVLSADISLGALTFSIPTAFGNEITPFGISKNSFWSPTIGIGSIGFTLSGDFFLGPVRTGNNISGARYDPIYMAAMGAMSMLNGMLSYYSYSGSALISTTSAYAQSIENVLGLSSIRKLAAIFDFMFPELYASKVSLGEYDHEIKLIGSLLRTGNVDRALQNLESVIHSLESGKGPDRILLGKLWSFYDSAVDMQTVHLRLEDEATVKIPIIGRWIHKPSAIVKRNVRKKLDNFSNLITDFKLWISSMKELRTGEIPLSAHLPRKVSEFLATYYYLSSKLSVQEGPGGVLLVDPTYFDNLEQYNTLLKLLNGANPFVSKFLDSAKQSLAYHYYIMDLHNLMTQNSRSLGVGASDSSFFRYVQSLVETGAIKSSEKEFIRFKSLLLAARSKTADIYNQTFRFKSYFHYARIKTLLDLIERKPQRSDFIASGFDPTTLTPEARSTFATVISLYTYLKNNLYLPKDAREELPEIERRINAFITKYPDLVKANREIVEDHYFSVESDVRKETADLLEEFKDLREWQTKKYEKITRLLKALKKQIPQFSFDVDSPKGSKKEWDALALHCSQLKAILYSGRNADSRKAKHTTAAQLLLRLAVIERQIKYVKSSKLFDQRQALALLGGYKREKRGFVIVHGYLMKRRTELTSKLSRILGIKGYTSLQYLKKLRTKGWDYLDYYAKRSFNHEWKSFHDFASMNLKLPTEKITAIRSRMQNFDLDGILADSRTLGLWMFRNGSRFASLRLSQRYYTLVRVLDELKTLKKNYETREKLFKENNEKIIGTIKDVSSLLEDMKGKYENVLKPLQKLQHHYERYLSVHQRYKDYSSYLLKSTIPHKGKVGKMAADEF